NENHRPTTKMILSHDTVLIDNERALAERDRERIEKDHERIEKDRLQVELNRERIEKDQQKRRADTTQSELDRQKTKTNESQELVRAFQQQVETTQSEVTRLTTEVRNLKAELSKLRPLTTTSIQQVKSEPKVLQIQQSVPPSLNPNMLVGIIPNKKYAYQQGLKIIHTDKDGYSTIAFNPIISNGIVRFGGFFEDTDDDPYFGIGISDSSAVFGSKKAPWYGENCLLLDEV
ncbi:MAG: hypothetical protein EZS28_046613, partial [Streblomastix strix]